ncbi:hypothetical protein [uncultured Gammaproteobacteria bacterium]|jgi:hypothetical protein|nr:hypothetical protein [uncultured Gammaproteobacteria bacterium]CAC9552989.1 hypothetical protein [uncultured Gammaproteobacteria bacterium]CAC9553662.1 hypothetical protein [uncultured Gammaproteobacteria bacterium]CAC9560706.1 hypothetical protein [uncultured Gammaproteobacteria bacterium]CAC9560989.1 hypothetical protein [uncultured Gammaproteobacteria bacterium]
MLDFWHNYKVRYLRKHNTLDFDSMRELSVPSRIIKEVLLNEVINEIEWLSYDNK